MSTQDYYQQSISENYEEALHNQNHQQPCGMQNCQAKEFTFFKELKFLIYHCITFGNFELDEIKCSWIVTIFSNITIAILLVVIDIVIDKKVKTNYEFCYKILKFLIFFILSGIVKIFLFVPQHSVNAFAITPFLVFIVSFNIIINFYVSNYFDVKNNNYYNIIALCILTAISFISFIRIILKTHKFFSKKRFEVSIILSLVVIYAEIITIGMIMDNKI